MINWSAGIGRGINGGWAAGVYNYAPWRKSGWKSIAPRSWVRCSEIRSLSTLWGLVSSRETSRISSWLALPGRARHRVCYRLLMSCWETIRMQWRNSMPQMSEVSMWWERPSNHLRTGRSTCQKAWPKSSSLTKRTVWQRAPNKPSAWSCRTTPTLPDLFWVATYPPRSSSPSKADASS